MGTVHGSMDTTVPKQDASSFNSVIQSHTLHIVDGADHFFSNHHTEVVKLVTDAIDSLI
eukprot:NODE_1024_length_627_cov_162.652249_g952_i0.p5 GENE.NODE_1024_length_627_cov_162.652249_g952_i0~~NODE_1024_length_627_cov_162.652249_g952_i0.p5  ORF type:complete len:67 (+),score=15.79 NODE_1024_length_627_cov_162.652249_g952_i0:27-203(+)